MLEDIGMSNELLLLTGMSGAGRSTVAHALEDSGWYVVDNLPPSLLLGLAQASDSPRIAVVVDVRTGKYFDDLSSSIKELRGAGINYRMLFLDASDQALVQRFESTRRPHPLQGSGRIVDGIIKERVRLEEFRADADQVIDSFDGELYRSAKYVVQTTHGTDYQTIEILLMHNGTNVYITRYGLMYTNTELASFTATKSGNSIRLLATPANTNTSFKFTRTVVQA